jgi:very-short-patch-repair endonuclease
MSPPEVMLWTQLRGRGADQPTFRRQHPFGSIILDFYCPAARLVVEVDGASHWEDEAHARDEARDAWLRQQDIEVMRIPASQVFHDLSGAAAAIIFRAQERIAAARSCPGLAPSTPRSSLRSAGGPPPAASRGR